MQLIFDIPDEKLNELKTGYLRCAPVPLDFEGQPIMGELEWIKSDILKGIFNKYKTGKQLIAQDSVVITEDLIN